jgi:two-component system heavy metal sensor histidine kinase CusS
MKNPLSLTLRISLLVAGSAACILLVAGFLFELAFEKQFEKHDMEELVGKMGFIHDELRNITSPAAITALPLRLRDETIGHPGIAITVAGGDGTVFFSVGRNEVVKLLLEGTEIGKSQPSTWSIHNHIYRVAANRFALGMPATQPANVAIALDITDDQKFVNEFKTLLWFGMFLAALLTGWLGWAAVRRGLRPLHDVSALMANVSAQELDKLAPIAAVPVELQELSSAFNRMLMRLNDSFRQLSEFSSDLAHELRTPIHTMMVQTQVTLSRERDTDEYCANLQSNLEELERLSQMVSDMLFLAKADNNLVIPKEEVIDLQSEASKVLSFYEALASEHRVHLVQSGAATVCADRLLLQRALSNLLSNAIRFTPEGLAVKVTIAENATQAMIAIENPGPQIPAEHLPKIFERLYRADSSRREGVSENTGLGLAITKSIVELQGGTIEAESEAGRTCFTITLPRRQCL